MLSIYLSSDALRHLLLVFLLLQWSFVFGQYSDITSSCTKIKKDVFERKVGFSFLVPNAPVLFRTEDNCRKYAGLIVGGTAAELKEFPMMSRLGHRTIEPPDTKWFCGGTLISERYVLTAAHCFEAPQGEVNVVRIGDVNFSSTKDDTFAKDYAVDNYLAHPNYKEDELYHDIGLIKLAENVVFDVYKHPACLPFEGGNAFDEFIAAGWGFTNTQILTNTLNKVTLKRCSDETCNRTVTKGFEYPHGYDPKIQMCVGCEKNKDTCGGDSGGPLLAYHKEYPCMYHVMGVTSAGIGCGILPSPYTRVHEYLTWIQEQINK